jgi:hypothetical protein
MLRVTLKLVTGSKNETSTTSPHIIVVNRWVKPVASSLMPNIVKKTGANPGPSASQLDMLRAAVLRAMRDRSFAAIFFG